MNNLVQKPCIPLSRLDKLRCKICEKFVTCGPVHILPDEAMLCGRCTHLAKNIYRNFSYEALASMYLYPCYNWEKHCSRSLQWNESLSHEDNCAYSSCCSRFWRRGVCCRGRREVPLGDIRLTPVPEPLLEEIKCVQCELYLSCEPVFIQLNGKNVCHRCIYSNGPPPNSIRNVMYETLSSIVIFPCIYRWRGCTTRLKFGRDLWHHESECSYSPTFKKVTKNISQKEKGVISQKERGVILTHSGHRYGTITPNAVLFAPPNPKTEFDVNKEILKSLKKHQERKLISMDQIESQMNERYSDDCSIVTDFSSSDKKNSYDKLSSNEGTSSSRSDENDQIQRNNMNYTPENRDSVNASPNRNYNQNIIMAQVHQENNKNANSRPVSYKNQQNDLVYIPYPDYLQRQDSRESYDNMDNSMLAGHLPIFRNSEVIGLAYQPSFRGLNRTESMQSNRELIQELRVKQKLMKSNSIRKDYDSPYKKCNNLEDVINVHDNITK